MLHKVWKCFAALAVAVLVLACAAVPAWADNIAEDDWGTCHWELTDDGALTVHPGVGANQEYYDDLSPWIEMESSISSIVFAAQGDSKVVAPESIHGLFAGLTQVKSIDLSGLKTSATTDMSGLFAGCRSLETLNLAGLDTSKVTNMFAMFSGCSSLAAINLSGFSTVAATDMGQMFSGCSSLTTLNLGSFSTANVTSMNGMFQGCSSLAMLDLAGFNTQNVESFELMFYGCSSLTSLDVSMLSTAKAQTTWQMFAGCTSLASVKLPVFGTEYLTEMGRMFEGCTSLATLSLKGAEAVNLLGMERMFQNCSSLNMVIISGFEAPNLMNMSYMFSGCSSLVALSISDFVAPELRDLSYMFNGCSSLEVLDLSVLNTVNAENMKGFFNGCSSLVEYTVSENFVQPTTSGKWSAPAGTWVSASTGLELSGTDLAHRVAADTYTRATLAGAVIADIPNQEWTGSAIVPEISVTLGDKLLVEGTDYTVACANNIGLGTATVTVTGAGKYVGTLSSSFEIVAANIENAIIAPIDDMSYYGFELWPDHLIVTYNDKQLKEDTDFTVEYSNNVEVGEATLKLTGMGNFAGTKTDHFNIVRADIAEAYIEDIPDQTYTGAAIEPGVKVSRAGTLVEGTDYTVSYANNVDPGVATATITGIGNYTGTASKTFNIVAPVLVDLSNATFSTIADQYYWGSALEPGFTVRLDGKLLHKGTDYTYAYSNNDGVGVATITITGVGGYTGTASTTFNILQGTIDFSDIAEVVAIPDQAYTGREVTPAVKVTLGSDTLAEGRDYTVQYKDNVEVGTATVIVTGIGDYTGIASATFEIVAAVPELAITAQPKDATGAVGETATFSVVATGDGLTYRWQWSRDNGQTWANSSSSFVGYNADTMQVPITAVRNGYLYRCVVSDASGATATSDAARLTVSSASALAITAQPKDATGAVGTTASFTVAATGDGLGYRWQWSRDDGRTWANSSSSFVGYNADTMRVPITAARDGYLYRCVVTDASGATLASDAARLTVSSASALAITAQPEDASGAIGETAFFSVAATGDGLGYRWQWSRDGGQTWANSSASFVGYNEATMQVPVTAARDGYLYRCVVTDASGATLASDAARLTVSTAAALAITAQPDDASGAVGTTAFFSVAATGDGLSYRWQWSRDGGQTWANSSASFVGYNEATMQVPVTAARDGYLYRCVVTDASGATLTSDAARLTVSSASALAITAQPEDATGAVGTTASFTVAATGDGLSYRWQWSRDNGQTWANSSSSFAGYNEATMQVPITAVRNGYLYRCVVTDASGATLTSDAARLTVASASALAITAQPKDAKGAVGTTALFSVAATGDGLTYRWQWSRDGGQTWANSSASFTGYNSDTMQVPVTAVRHGYRYRCVVTDASGVTLTSDAATLTVG